MGVENIGICNYVDSIINYFVLFSALGIGAFGVREIARCKDDIKKRSEVFSNLLIFNMLLTLISVLVLLFCTFYIDYFHQYKDFIFIGILKLVFEPLCINWFFQGIQEFRYITIRSIVFRVLSIVLLFALVHTKEDVLWYYSLSVITSLLCAVCNIIYSRHFVYFTLRNYSPFLYLTPILTFGYYMILTSLYTTFNTFFLGSTSGNVEVGYFATACKLNTIIMSAFTALTTVMVPKVAEMLNDGKKKELQIMADKIFSVLTSIALPIIIICIFCAPHIIFILSGPGYEGAVPAFRIVICTILIIGLEQIVIRQFLMASKSNKNIFMISTTGAIVGLTLNILLTPRLCAIGSALSWLSSELSVLIVGLILLRKTIGIIFSIKSFAYDILYSILYIIVLIPIYWYVDNIWVCCILSFIGVFFVFVAINIYFRPNQTIISLFMQLGKHL